MRYAFFRSAGFVCWVCTSSLFLFWRFVYLDIHDSPFGGGRFDVVGICILGLCVFIFRGGAGVYVGFASYFISGLGPGGKHT